MTINVKLYEYCQQQECSVDVERLPNEVLAPLFVEANGKVTVMNLLPHTFRTLSRIGVKYRVAFVPVDSEEYEFMEKQYNLAVNNYLEKFRKSRRKYPQEVISYEDWVNTDDFSSFSTTSDVEQFLLSDMLTELTKEVQNNKPKQFELFKKLVENDGEKSLDAVIELLGIKRSTGYNHLKSLRQFVEEVLKDIT
ncbi:TPA: hypothetical protein U1Y72_000647 [Streptococcus suis]|nr:hypothetical protein [Streptococcus suis]NQI92736.1 hypothetical protein [Streptococcus suis]NQJ00585.1 hypothetical protein [Streptococcus suis]HEM4248695.1 hypothetical protein [Streptococcus suis]HEM4402351.1 hypothetical protein [Streptococcus suis]